MDLVLLLCATPEPQNNTLYVSGDEAVWLHRIARRSFQPPHGEQEKHMRGTHSNTARAVNVASLSHFTLHVSDQSAQLSCSGPL